jgi:hypothetical protein
MKSPSTLAILLLSLVALAHLARFLWHVPITIGQYEVPLWFSIVGVLVPSALALALSRERRAWSGTGAS